MTFKNHSHNGGPPCNIELSMAIVDSSEKEGGSGAMLFENVKDVIGIIRWTIVEGKGQGVWQCAFVDP